MPDFPSSTNYVATKVLSPFSPEIAVQTLFSHGAVQARSSAAWPSANLAMFVPVICSAGFTVVKFAAENGLVSGNIDVGLYTSEGQRIVSAGSTAQAGATQFQVFDVTDTYIPAGLYYLAIALDNNTGQNARQGIAANVLRMAGVQQMASAFPLPATATFAAMAQGYYPSVFATSTVTI